MIVLYKRFDWYLGYKWCSKEATISSIDMQSFLKHTKTLPEYLMNAMLKPRRQAYFFAKECDPQSNCCKTAREILLLLEKKKDNSYQNERVKEEIWTMIDHEKLLSEYKCCVLAKLTLQELLRHMIQYNSKEEFILFIEDLVLEMEKKYTYELNYHYAFESYPFNSDDGQNQAIDLQALTYKHMGHGMEYLKHKSIKATHDFKGNKTNAKSSLLYNNY